ncbi:MAG: phosphatidate cytidylyltransferase [Kiritimatiellae bacterium]|nr:phosphatidate cytidylyltransferase [Kiritimatiellia bacterium]
MNPTLKRTVTALATAALVVLAFVFIPQRLVRYAVVAVSALVQLEFYLMVRAKYHSAPAIGIFMGTLFLLGTPPVPMFFAAAAAIMLSKRYSRPLETLATTLFGVLYIPVLLSAFISIASLAPAGRIGIYTLLYVVSATKLSDMGGFAFGKAFGKHKMCPAISPKKSWEGFGGSVFGAFLATCIFISIAKANSWSDAIAFWKISSSYLWAIPLGLFFAAFGTMGDLVESRIKREVEVKDSATFMPAGLGGFLDMFDSILFTPALFLSILPFFP